MGEPTIEITGSDPDEAERELQDLLRTEFGQEGRRVERPARHAPGERIEATTLAMLAFIVALPGGIRNTIDLVEKMKLRDKATRLVAWAKRRGSTGTRIDMVSAKGRSIDLAGAEPGDVIEVLIETDDLTAGSEAKR